MEVIFDFGIGERERRWNKKTLNLEFSGFGRQPVSLSSPDKSVVITATQEYAIRILESPNKANFNNFRGTPRLDKQPGNFPPIGNIWLQALMINQCDFGTCS